MLLNNDVVVTEGWLEQLIGLASIDQESKIQNPKSKMGLVGPMSNYATPPQLVERPLSRPQRAPPLPRVTNSQGGVVTSCRIRVLLNVLCTKEEGSGTGLSAEAVTYSYDDAGRLTGRRGIPTLPRRPRSQRRSTRMTTPPG